MNHCKDCKHWDRSWITGTTIYGSCKHPKREEMDLFYVDDYGTLMVHPDFGCIEFEAK